MSRAQQKNIALFRRLAAINRAIATSSNTPGVLTLLLENAVELVDADFGVLLTPDEHNHRFHLRTSHGIDKKLERFSASTDEFVLEKLRIRLNLAPNYPLHAVPVLNESSLGGLLIVGLESGLSEEEVWALSALADQTAIALRNGRLYDLETGELAIVNRDALDALTTSEQRLNNALKAANVGTWDWDIRTDSLVWSDGHYRILGLKPGQVRPSYRVWAERLHPDDVPKINAALEHAVKTRQEFRGVYRAVWPNGTVRWVESRGQVVYAADGTPEHILGVINDITERKEAEIEVGRLASIVDFSTDAIYSKDLDGLLTSWNAGAEKLYGYTAREALGKPISIIVPSGRQEEHRQITERVTRGERVEPFETVRVRKDGRRVDISLSISPIKDASGVVVGASSIARDITDQKRVREELLRSEEFNRRILENSNDCIEILDLEGRVVFINEARRNAMESARISDYLNSNWTKFWSGAGSERARSAITAARKGDVGRFQGTVVTKDGVTRWWDVVITLICDTTESPGRLLAISRDITEQKMAEESSRESREQLEFALRAADMTAYTWDIQSGEMSRLGSYGLESQHAEEESSSDFWTQIYEGNNDIFRSHIEQALKNGGYYESEDRHYLPGGSIKWIRDTGKVVFDEKGKASKLFGIATDITERKHAEGALRQSEDFFRTIVHTASEGVLLLNPKDERLILVNDRMASILGYRREELAACTLNALCFPEDLEDFRRHIDLNIAGESQQFEFRLRRKDGDAVHVLACTSRLCDAQGNPVGALGMFTDITEQRQITQALRESEQRLRLAVEDARIGIWDWDPVADKLVLSEELESLMGFKAGHNPSNFKEWLESVHPDDREDVERIVRRSLETGQSYELQFRIIWPDGSIRWIAGTAAVHFESGKPARIMGVGMDVTERKLVEEGLEGLLDRQRRLATQLRKLVESSFEINSDLSQARVLGAVTDKAREIIGAHQAFTTLISDVTSTTASFSPKYSDWVQADASPYLQGLSSLVCRLNESMRLSEQAILAHPAWRGRIREEAHRPPMRGFLAAPLVGRDGRNIGLIQLSDKEEGEFNDDDENVLAQLALVASAAIENLRLFDETQREIADRKQAEEERNFLLQREKEAREAAETANRIKDEFLATISHELRTPLTAILGWSKILQNSTTDSRMHLHALETIERNAQAQAQLIEDLLDVSRIISGKLRFESRLLQLQTVVHAAIEAVRPAAEAKDIIIEADYDPSVDSIFGDSTRVQQIIWNLLTNAVKFTPPGGRVQVKLERRDAVAVVSVKDSGAGISPEFLPYVFERFRQADGTTTRRQGGLGLGLAIVSHLVEMHGGTVEAQSEGLDRGSTFVVTFPLAAFIPAVSLEMQDTIAYNAQGRHDDLQGLHIHVVDDEPDAVELLRVMLAQYGASVTTSSSAQHAIGSIRQSWPDLLISDIGMPYQDGYELIRELRDMDEERGKLLPAIALTAYAAIEDQQRAVLAGFQTHVTKPVEPQVLINAITQLTGRAQVNDEHYKPEGWKDV